MATHRYETALNFSRELFREMTFPENSAAHYTPAFLPASSDPGLLILPTHRLVNSLPSFHPKLLVEKLKESSVWRFCRKAI